MIKVGIDIGNSKTSSIVCDIKNNGSKKVLSFISNPRNNIKKGYLTNLALVKEQVKNLIFEAQKESQTEIKSIILNLSAIDSISLFSNSEIEIMDEQISELHLKKAINKSDLFEPINDYEVIKNLIIDYNLDNKVILENPIGAYAKKIKINFYRFAVNKNFIKILADIFNDLKINIESYVPSPLSSALATLNEDDKLLGAVCIDLGAFSSSVSIMENEKIFFMDAINIGGQNITNDIARGIPTDLESAERLKTLYGSVISTPSDEHELIDVPYIGEEVMKSKQITRSDINLIIKPRVEETLELIWQKMKEYNLHKKQIKNLVLTGGGSLIEGISDYAQAIFDSNVRIGKPKKIDGISENFLKPQFSQTIGTILYNKSDYEIDFLKNKEKITKNKIFGRFFTWLDKYI